MRLLTMLNESYFAIKTGKCSSTPNLHGRDFSRPFAGISSFAKLNKFFLISAKASQKYNIKYNNLEIERHFSTTTLLSSFLICRFLKTSVSIVTYKQQYNHKSY